MRYLMTLLALTVACTPPKQQSVPQPQQPQQPQQPNTPPQTPRVNAPYVLTNQTNRQALVRVRRLRSDVSLDCAALREGPVDALLTRELFAPAESWLLEPRAQLAVEAPSACGLIALVDGNELPLRLLVDLGGNRADIALNEAGNGSLRLDTASDLLRPAPFAVPEPLAEACGERPDAGADWAEVPPAGDWKIDALTRGPDGCHAFDLSRPEAEWATRWYACTPAALPFEVGERVTFVQPSVDEVRILGARAAARIVRGQADLAPEFETQPIVGCAPAVDPCGNVVHPLAVSVVDDAGAVRSAGVGERVDLGAGHTLTITRAERLIVVDGACRPNTSAGRTLVEFTEILPLED